VGKAGKVEKVGKAKASVAMVGYDVRSLGDAPCVGLHIFVPTMPHFQTLLVWQKARRLTKNVYKTTGTLPGYERSHLGSQMRRAVISIVSNIAEGTGRFGLRDQLRMMQIAMGSGRELEAQAIAAFDLGFVSRDDTKRLVLQVREVQRMLAGLLRHKRQKLAALTKKRKANERDP
jgi:four helix bundle protein